MAEGLPLWGLLEEGDAGGLREADPDPDAGLHELPLLDDTTAQDGPCATILALRPVLVTQIEEGLNRRNGFVFDEADKLVDIGFEVYVTRTLLAIPNTNMKVSSKDVSTVIQPQRDSTAFRNLNIDRNDDEGKVHGTEKTLEQACTRDRSILQEDLQIFIPGGQAAGPHAGLGPGPLFRSCSRRCTRRTT